MPAGRPSKYSDKVAKEICYKIATCSDGLQKICEANDKFPSYKVVFDWLNDERKIEFRKWYARAREAQTEFIRQEMQDISDDCSKDNKTYTGSNHVQRARLRVDTRKWLMAKLAPKKYGEKLDITTDGEKINNQTIDLSKLSDEEIKNYLAIIDKAANAGGAV